MAVPVDAARTILFVDFEASSVERGSFPIEIGWCGVNGEGEAHLIRPVPDWTAWSDVSEKIHGITREQLHAEGKPVREVARRAAVAFSPRTAMVLSDAPAFDEF